MPRVLARLDFVEKRVRALSTSAANASKAGDASVGAVSASKATQAMVLQNKHAVAQLKRFASHLPQHVASQHTLTSGASSLPRPSS